jgi:TrmH family RNA methyltransferase
MNTDIKENIVVVLDRPQDAVNIGATVRALKNMGFARLRLINPRPFSPQAISRVAHHADDVIAAIHTYPSLDAALADTVYVVGTSAIAHEGRPLRNDVEILSRELLQRAQTGPVALLFGTEDDGLDSAALARCHCLATLPVNPLYPALNLAQSVLLFLYELLRQVRTEGAVATPSPALRATTATPQAQLEHMFALGEQALSTIGFFKYNPDVAMRTLRGLAYRAELQPQEAALIMAIARQAIYTAARSSSNPGDTALHPPTTSTTK